MKLTLHVLAGQRDILDFLAHRPSEEESFHTRPCKLQIIKINILITKLGERKYMYVQLYH